MEKSPDSSIPFISYDETIIEVLDKKWKKYLIPRVNILQAKYELSKESNINEEELMTLTDKDNKELQIVKEVILNLKEDNLLYHWLIIDDINNEKIIVKKEHLIAMKISKEPTVIMDYFGKKRQILSGKVCWKAKKYHSTEGKNGDNILFKLKDENNNIYFIPKPIIKFAKKKRMLNDETYSIEITDKDNKVINVPLENIRDLDESNPYSEYCEIQDTSLNNIIVKKVDLQNLKEMYDKNIIPNNEIKKIRDYKLDTLYNINANEQYDYLFPYKYEYKPNKSHSEYIDVFDIYNKKVVIKTNLLEYFLSENLIELPLYEEAYDINKNLIKINPFEIAKSIIMKYDDVMTKMEPCLDLVTQSGSVHFIRIKTIKKVIDGYDGKNDYVNIKDSNGVKIVTSVSKLKTINLNSNNVIIIPLEDIYGQICYIKKDEVMKIVDKVVAGKLDEENTDVFDYSGKIRKVNVRQINMKNSALNKRY